MTPGTYNITIYQGADLDIPITWKDEAQAVIDLSGYSAKFVARDSFGKVVLSLTKDDGITVAATSPNVRITRTAVQTAALDYEGGTYNLELTSAGGTVYRLLEGRCTLSRETAR
jgi:hypothetical protein